MSCVVCRILRVCCVCVSLVEMQDFVLSKNILNRQVCEVASLMFHPDEQILISGDMNGNIDYLLYDENATCSHGNDGKSFNPHKGASVRCMDYIPNVNGVVSSDADGRIVLSSFDPKIVSSWKFKDGMNTVRVLNENILVGGDDEGKIRGIDIREKKSIFSISKDGQTDFISSLTMGCTASPLKTLVSTSGDCTLAVYDLRSTTKSIVAISDEQEDEINCSLLMNNEQHVLTGNANGVVGIWKQGYWGDLKDRLPLYNKGVGVDGSRSIDYMKKIDETHFLTVTTDGVIRLVNLFPNVVEKIIGVAQDSATVSAMDCDIESNLIAICNGGDEKGTIKFFNIANIETNDPVQFTKSDNPEKANRQSFFGDI